MEKQRDKAARRMQRKLEERQTGESGSTAMDGLTKRFECSPLV
jgi:hypothetical protein